jgi:DNA (cytosine-5)-methyltransferase 1
MNVLDLFSGIGGFSLGLERAGMRTVAFCEIDPYCRRVLRKHWPSVPIYDDIRTLNAGQLPIGIDVICGGFPCQDISVAGKGAGIEGERSGLWSEYARIIGELRPRYVIVENVAALLGRGLDRVLGDLAALGFDAEWHCIPASAVGAPHRRDRVWIVAHAISLSERRGAGWGEAVGGRSRNDTQGPSDNAVKVADADDKRLEGRLRESLLGCPGQWTAGEGDPPIPNANGEPADGIAEPRSQCGSWLPEPNVGRVAHGVSARVDRLRSLGNSVVPQIPEIIGRAIMTLTSRERPSE